MANKKPKSKRHSQTLIIVSICLTVILIASGVFIVPCISPGPFKKTIVMIPESPTIEQLADTLTKHFDKSFSDKTVRIARLMGNAFKLRHGAFEIAAGASPLQAARKIGRGARYIVTVSINNIRTPQQLADKVSDQLYFNAEDLLKAMRNEKLLSEFGLDRNNVMSLFISDNYEFYWETNPEEFIQKMGENYLKFWNDERKKKASQLGLSPVDVEIIASIADEESNKADEKGRICRLYYNRLKKRMRLQADPTVKYALGDFAIKRVTKDHLKTSSPYNTYKNEGLPPGPIRITDKQTVDAFLTSAPTTDIYMCAKEDFSGYHVFTSSYNEHIANARRYQEKLNSAGIK